MRKDKILLVGSSGINLTPLNLNRRGLNRSPKLSFKFNLRRSVNEALIISKRYFFALEASINACSSALGLYSSPKNPFFALIFSSIIFFS